MDLLRLISLGGSGHCNSRAGSGSARSGRLPGCRAVRAGGTAWVAARARGPPGFALPGRATMYARRSRGARSMGVNGWHVLAGAALVLLAMQSAGADDAETCAKESGNVAIAACTRAIESGRYKGRDLAVIYSKRGKAWNAKDRDRAIADHTEAIRLDPKNAVAYFSRGYAWLAKDEDRAIADFNEAIRLNPQYASAYNNRGVLWSAKGYLDRAITD